MKLYRVECEDGAILYEFHGKGWRGGISIESDHSESGWYFAGGEPAQINSGPLDSVQGLMEMIYELEK